MQYFSTYTDDCLKDAQKFNLTDELNNLVFKIEKNQTSKFLEKYRSPALVKRAGAYRFVGYELIIQDKILIIFLRILHKGKKDYDEFCKNSDEFCKKILPDSSWIDSIILQKNNLGIKEKPDLSELEKSYLFTPIPDSFDDSLMIYESKKFTEGIQKSDYKIHFSEIIRDILEEKDSNNNHSKKHKKNDNLVIYYILNEKINVLFLFQALNTNKNEKFDEYNFSRILNSMNSIESIMKESFRTYPSYILYDENIWLEIQEESEGNLALSTEEAQIFNSIIHNNETENLFPLFINGRAGSGKSTLLYYIFSHILLNHILREERLNLPPLFLTYSPKLLDTASNTIKKILKSNTKIRLLLHDIHNKYEQVEQYLNSQDYDKSFKTFRDFQRDLLPLEQKALFADKNYYNFAKFKDDWSNYCKKNPSSSIRKITPEFAWYVIRTFIKGMRTSSDDFLEPEDYSNLPRDLKTVDFQTYENIYKEVFLRWYKNHLIDNHFWDDQDLTRHILDTQDELNLDYPAVFCDEAQDFSEIELELISSLPIFSRRKLNYSDIKRIPIAFAGDPLQTINPTGFKWSSIKAYFYEKINSDLEYSKKIPINFKELNNNYRSSKPIVVFNNIIQLIRAILFNLNDIQPQTAWFSSGFHINPTLKINDLSVIDEALKEESKTKTIIIPCEEDQEKDFILNRDSFLKERAIIGDEIVANIWSPMNVKGLEYNTVIVYNFGDYLASSIGINLNELLSELLESNNSGLNLEEFKKIQLEYFLNKLYVATSRAKKNLVIVDTEIGNKYLWSIFNNQLKNLTSFYALFINDNIVWEQESEISEFQFSAEALELAVDKPEDLAKQLFNDGISTSNPRKLKSAAEYFRVANKQNEQYKALAKAYELENNYSKAAEYYEKIQDGDRASQCLWLSNDKAKYTKIIEVYKKLPQNPNNLFKLAAEFMILKDKKSNSIIFLRNFGKLFSNIESPEFYLLTDRSWSEFFGELLKSLIEYSALNPNLSDWDEVLETIRKLFNDTILYKYKKEFIKLLFNLRQYKDVIDELKLINDTDNEFYLKANAEYLQFPNNLEYLFKLNQYDRIVSLIDKNFELNISYEPFILEIMLNALLNYSDPILFEKFIIKFNKSLNSIFKDKLLEKIFIYCFDKKIYTIGFKVIEFLDDRKEDEFYVNLLKNYLNHNDKNLITFLIALLLYQEFLYNRYHTVIDILENNRIELNFISPELINYFVLEKLLIQVLAYSDKITAKPEPKKRMQEYIRELLVNSDRWRQMVEVQIAGTAIEKLEFHINARDFYEKIIKGNFSDEEKEFAKIRWLKVKEKQANRENPMIRQQIMDDVTKAISRWGLDDEIKLSDIPEFPEISKQLDFSFEELSIANEVSQDKKTIDFRFVFNIDGTDILSFKKISEKSLLKIENLKLEEIIYFDLNTKEFDSKETDYFLEDSFDGINQYNIPKWELIIHYNQDLNSQSLSFFYKTIKNKLFEIPI